MAVHVLINDDSDVNILSGASFLQNSDKFPPSAHKRANGVVMMASMTTNANIKISWKTSAGCGSYLIHQVDFSKFIECIENENLFRTRFS